MGQTFHLIQKVVDRLELPLTSLKSYHETSPKKMFEVLPDAKDGRLHLKCLLKCVHLKCSL